MTPVAESAVLQLDLIPTPDPQQAKRIAKNERGRRWWRKRQESKRVPPEELSLFRANPMRENELGWDDVMVCRLCGLRTKSISAHLRGHVEELSNGSPGVDYKLCIQEYRRRFGYGDSMPLLSATLRRRHAEIFRDTWAKQREGMIKGMIDSWADAEVRRSRSEAGKLAWTKPEVRERRREGIREALRTPEARQRRSDLSKQAWSNPEYAKRVSEGLRRTASTPEARKRRSEAARRAMATPEARQRQSELSKRMYEDPEMRKKVSQRTREALSQPEVQMRKSTAGRQAWSRNPARRQKLSEETKRRWAEQRARLAVALPADWRAKPLLWRVIGMELISEDRLSNRGLAARLDVARVGCPYGTTWQESVEARNFTVLINRIRNWVRKPGPGRVKRQNPVNSLPTLR
ncbi:MAG: hypothetical protein ACLQAT_24500 [Candidatus Binataceae bacterium]